MAARLQYIAAAAIANTAGARWRVNSHGSPARLRARPPSAPVFVPKRIPTHRPKGMPTRREQNAAYDKARNEDEIRRQYNSNRWRTLRVHILDRDPFCVRCLRAEPPLRTPSTTVNHIKKARDFPEMFFDDNNLEGVCAPCHSSDIQAEERRAERDSIQDK